MKRSDPKLPRWLIAPALVALCAAALPACLGDTELGGGQPLCPSPEDFRAVSNVLERRCGTLDCHGHPARPFIVFGQYAYRRPGGEVLAIDPDEYVVGGLEATTDFEVEGTYQSACGLEPEEMDGVVKAELGADDLTLVRKPRLREKHKGGRIWGAGTTRGDLCLVSWLQGDVDEDACRRELELP